MRIITGTLKGRRLNPPENLPVRPTTDMARESLFNILNNMTDYENISVFDPKRYPAYTPDASQYFGIFRPDHVHFLREVNEWVAGEIMAELQ